MMRAKLSTCALLFAVSQPLFAASSLPDAGMSMKAVEAQFGQPQRRDAAVGNPPITRWEYADFVVVFERSTVVHSMSVVRGGGSAPAAAPAAANPAAPAPAPKVAPAPAPAPAAAPVTAPAVPAAAAPAIPVPASTAAPAPADPAADAMNKAAAEKAAAGTDAAPAAPAPAPEPGYTFDPETGRIIVK